MNWAAEVPNLLPPQEFSISKLPDSLPEPCLTYIVFTIRHMGAPPEAPPVERSNTLFVCLFVCLFGWLVGWLVVCLFVCLFVSLLVCLCVGVGVGGWVGGWKVCD